MTSVGSAISVTGLVRGYGSGKNRVDVLQGLDMDVQSGSIYGLLGPSGCGKTTLLKVSLGFLSPESGVVSVPPDIPGSGVGYSPQEIALCRVLPDQAGHTFDSRAAGSQVRRGFHRPTQLVGLTTPLLLSSNRWACTS